MGLGEALEKIYSIPMSGEEAKKIEENVAGFIKASGILEEEVGEEEPDYICGGGG